VYSLDTGDTVQTADVIIGGGGLAGLACAIQLAKKGYRVMLIEKENYPFHRVCGEYISMESWNFLESLGYSLSNLQLPRISQLQVSAPNGKLLTQALPLGGFGISRYKIDNDLAALAGSNNVQLMEGVRINDIAYLNEGFTITTSNCIFYAPVVIGSFGKRSNIDTKWQRPFIQEKSRGLNNYIGVKYHLQTDFPDDTIALHNFEDGYCGISKIEGNSYCCCYLTTSANLKKCGGNIAEMEKTILSKNPYLKEIFQNARFSWKEPVTIAQISFEKKEQVWNHILLAGDAAGMITPLCGNGMSMALHSSKIASNLIHRYLQKEISREKLEEEYKLLWNRLFAKRLATGRLIQKAFGKPFLTNLFLTTLAPLPFVKTWLIRQTHGSPF
jgi:flavin-dependent dehydrogenase